jgi:serpin B
MRSVLLAALLCTSALAAEPARASFSERLFQTLRKGRGNVFFSPLSVELAVAMTSAGARGDTAKEMRATLGLEAGRAGHERLGTMLRGWDALAGGRIQLHVVDRLWVQKRHALQKEFTTLLKDVYRAPLGELDFEHAPEPAREAINKWVDDATAHKIKELLVNGTIGQDTRLVLTNAVYMKAPWQHPFEAAATKEEPFFLDSVRQVKVPLMHQTHTFGLARLPSATVLELPYGDGALVMDVILPGTKTGLGQLEEKLVEGGLDAWLKELQPTRVDVTLPRFKSAGDFSLGPALAQLGMPRAFNPREADFSGIDGARDLFIGAVVHQAVISVDEQGTEAAAATAVVMAPMGLPPKALVFRADHPFVYLVRDPKSGAILFLGRLADPL